MLVVIEDFLVINNTIVLTIEGLKALVVLLSAKVVSMKALNQLLEKQPKKPAASKNKIETKLDTLLGFNSKKHVAYAVIKDDLDLELKVTFKKSDKGHMDDLSKLGFARTLYEANEANLVDLAKHGINATTQTDFLATINAFEAAIPKTRETTSSGATTLVDFESLVTETHNFVQKKLDKVVNGGDDVHAEFISNFYNNRKLINLAKSTIALKGTIKNSVTSAPIKGVIVSFGGHTVKSTKLGNFRIAHHEPGIASLTFSKPGFINKTVSATFNGPGETTILDIILQPA